MFIACETCGATTRVELTPELEAFTCGGCGRVKPLSVHCVPAGSMPHGEARRPKSGELAEDLLVPSYDPGFEYAISEGHLTVRQAVERGDRSLLASTIAQRHDLPMYLAFDVVDNRCSTLAAIQEHAKQGKASKPRSTRQPEGQDRRSFPWTATVLALAGLFSLAGWLSYSGPWDERAEPSTEPTRLTLQESRQMLIARESDRTEVRTDQEGQVTQIIGADPLSVLTAFCESRPEGDSPIVPVEVVQPFPDASAYLVGVFRDQNEAAALRGIAIREEQSTHRWIAGNGAEPVSLIDTRHLPRRGR